jgi:F0F1-type ATP synthase assembly protein I
MSLGLNFVSGVVLYFFLGYYLDDYLNHQFTFKIIGLFLGLFGSTYKLIKDVKKIDGVQKNQD